MASTMRSRSHVIANGYVAVPVLFLAGIRVNPLVDENYRAMIVLEYRNSNRTLVILLLRRTDELSATIAA